MTTTEQATATLTDAERHELADLRRMAGRDAYRSSFLDLVPGDVVRFFDAEWGVLHTEWFTHQEESAKRLFVIEFATQKFAAFGASAQEPVHDYDAATPDRVTAARARWAQRCADLRAELDELRASA